MESVKDLHQRLFLGPVHAASALGKFVSTYGPDSCFTAPSSQAFVSADTLCLSVCITSD
jgi:hypothetical protein